MLTKKQLQVLRFISDYRDKEGIAPSYREIADHLGTQSVGSITKYIKALEKSGHIERKHYRSRALAVVNAEKPEGLPLVGKIAAGKPIMAFENIERIDIEQFLTPAQGCFLLKVQGESMRDAGIMEGDYVLVKPSNSAKNGQIVVALVDGFDATLKRFHQEDSRIRLVPENKQMQVMTYPAERVVIQGIVVGQIRKYA